MSWFFQDNMLSWILFAPAIFKKIGHRYCKTLLYIIFQLISMILCAFIKAENYLVNLWSTGHQIHSNQLNKQYMGGISTRLFILNFTQKNVGKPTFFPVFASHKGVTLSLGSKNPTFFFYFCPKKCRMSDQTAPHYAHKYLKNMVISHRTRNRVLENSIFQKTCHAMKK